MAAVAVTAVREACAWTLDSIWTENYTLIYTSSKLIRNFIPLHEWLTDDYRVTGFQLTPTAPQAEQQLGKAGACSMPSSARTPGHSVVRATTEPDGKDKAGRSSCLGDTSQEEDEESSSPSCLLHHSCAWN